MSKVIDRKMGDLPITVPLKRMTFPPINSSNSSGRIGVYDGGMRSTYDGLLTSPILCESCAKTHDFCVFVSVMLLRIHKCNSHFISARHCFVACLTTVHSSSILSALTSVNLHHSSGLIVDYTGIPLRAENQIVNTLTNCEFLY